MDKDSGLVHHLKVTGANEHDVTAVPDLMHGEEKELYGDSGYIGAEKRENAVVKNKKRSEDQIQDKQKTIINEKAFEKRTVCSEESRA